MALPNCPSSLARPDIIFTEYRFRTHSMEKGIGKSSKSLIANQRSDRKLWPLRTVHPAWLNQTSSSSSIYSSSTPWKKASGNSSKSLIAIQRSDRKLLPFRTVNQARRDQTSSSPSIDSSSTPWKRASGNSVKDSSRSNGRITSYGPSELSIQPGLSKHHLHRVSIPYPLHGKGHPETRVKV